MDRIVVGVDGSEGSNRALQWAAEEATLRSATLELVHVYSTTLPSEGVSSSKQAERALQVPRKKAEDLLTSLVGEIDGIEVERHVIESGSPSHALVEHSREATMLVVSARGLGVFRSLVLGSVSQYCATHAECPVVIVRRD